MRKKIKLAISLPLYLLISLCSFSQDSIAVYRIPTGEWKRPEKMLAMQILEKHRPNLLVFSMYFSSCPPCVNEINAIYAKLKQMGLKPTELNFSVITSGRSDDPNMLALFSRSTIEENKWDFPIYADTNFAFATSLGHQYFPQTFLLDKYRAVLYVSDLTTDTVLPMRMAKLSDKLTEIPHATPKLVTFSIAELEQLMVIRKNAKRFQKLLVDKGFYKMDAAKDIYRNVINLNYGDYVTLDAEGDSVMLESSRLSDFDIYKQAFIAAGYKIISSEKKVGESVRLSKAKFFVSMFSDPPPKNRDYMIAPRFTITIKQ